MPKTGKTKLTRSKPRPKAPAAAGRNATGHFVAGNQGGPGRPRKPTPLSTDELRALTEAARHPYILAMTLRDSQGMEDVRRDFAPEIAAAIERVVQIGVLAERVLQRRLTAELQG